jgi:hypothetical protein
MFVGQFLHVAWSHFYVRTSVELFDMKTKFDESDHVLIRATRTVTDKLSELFGTSLCRIVSLFIHCILAIVAERDVTRLVERRALSPKVMCSNSWHGYEKLYRSLDVGKGIRSIKWYRSLNKIPRTRVTSYLCICMENMTWKSDIPIYCFFVSYWIWLF